MLKNNPKSLFLAIVGIVALSIKLGLDMFSDYIVAGGFPKSSLVLTGDALDLVFIACLVLAFWLARKQTQ